MSRLTLTALCILLCLAGGLFAEETWTAFPIDWNASPDSPASMAFLLETPAGKTGFVRAEQGHLANGAGARLRIWGVNFTATACFPTREAAPRLAAHLARCGVNAIRFHFLDRTAPAGLIDGSRSDTQAFDAAQLDRLDFFIAELKKRGIYANLNLNVGRNYKPGDGVPDCEIIGFGKGLTYFHPRLLELQKDYARQLLTHRNPYTGNEYRQEPAVALVELVNENSLVESWFSDRLQGKLTRKGSSAWSDIPAGYERELTELYNRWLREKQPADLLARIRAEAQVGPAELVPRLRPKQFAAASPERFQTELAFYMQLEQQFFDGMRQYLREEIGLKSLLVGNSDHNHYRSGYPLVASTSRLDVVDSHVYWQHPSYQYDPQTNRKTGFSIANTPMVNQPGRSTVVQLSRTAVAQKPFTVSEVNHPFPSEYACEGVPIVAAYAALHDWDGLFWYTFSHQAIVGVPPQTTGHFDLSPDPVKISQLAAGALLFLRGDVAAAQQTIGRSYSRQQVLESLRLPTAESPYFTPGFPATLPLIHAMRIDSLDGQPTAQFSSTPEEPLVSDTGQITWSGAAAKQGLVQINAPRWQALVGYVKARGASTDNLALRPENEFCAVTLSAMDLQPIAQASHLLLTLGSRVANSGQQWNEKRTSLEKWGQSPPVIDPVRGSVLLRNLKNAQAVRAQALDGARQPLGQAVDCRQTSDGWELRLGAPATTWWLIDVRR